MLYFFVSFLTKSFLSIQVHISNDGDPHLMDSAVLIINVTDTNDNAPIMNEISVNIPRNTALHTNIAQIMASDNDSSVENNQISYFLMHGGFDKFALDMNTGEMRKEVDNKFSFWAMKCLRSLKFHGLFSFIKIQTMLNSVALGGEEKMSIFCWNNPDIYFSEILSIQK